MKKLYFLLFFAFSFISNAQIINFTDANFKAKLLSASPSNTVAKNLAGAYFKIDSNSDGEIEVIEAEQVKSLNINSSNILNLLGISNFTNLQQLDCSNNQLTSLDVSTCIDLAALYCGFNQLNSLNTTNCINLSYLSCKQNQLTTLDASSCFNLNYLECGGNDLTSLNVTGLSALTLLTCGSNNLSDIDVSTCTSLQILSCGYNQLTSIDISACSSVYSLDCEFNPQLTIINIKNNTPFNAFSGSSFEFNDCPNIQYICSDENKTQMVQQKITNYGYTNCHVNSYCSFTPNGVYYEINGNTKFDSNTNGCDVNDIHYPNLQFSVTNGSNTGTFIANSTGDYYVPVSAGSHTITPVLENPTYFNISPTSFTVNFPTLASPFTQDFCVTANGVHSNVEITLIPTTPARPGFDSDYKIVYKNKGNQIENGTVTFTYFQEDALDLVNATPIFDIQNTTGNTTIYTWNYANLQPFETREILVTINLNSPMETPPLNAGDILSIEAQITIINNDEDLSNNYSAVSQNILNSYDPNDKTCLEGETVAPSMVGEYVHYVIRFENTGTYPAENIVVKDMIDTSKFDIATLIPLHGSHEFYTRINGNKVEFIFENINLDFNDATNDGYVAFKIKTLPTLTVGQSFSNNANIYFDYNFPITTNTYTTTIQALANPSFVFENEFVLYPNPASSTLTIAAKNQMEVQSVEVYNLVGQVVIAIPNATNTIDVSNLESGTYFIKVNTVNGNAVSKFVRE